MGATYTRQSSSGIVDGGVIEATDINNEFDQLLAAFAVSSGHTHDGTAAEGGPITKLLGTAITIGDGTAGTDIAVTFDGETGDGVLTWMEDEDYFKFSDEVLMNSTEKLLFGDTGTYIHQSADGVLDLVSDTEIEINATTIDINGNVDVSGTLTVAGAVDFGDAVLSNVGAVQLDSIAGDGDTNTSITFSGSDIITIATGGSGRLTIGDGALSPVTNNEIDLGTASLEFKDAFFDGTVTADAFAGPLTGNVTGNASGTAATVTTAAQSNITSLGTLTALTVDDVAIDGKVVTMTGSASDTAILTAGTNGTLSIVTTDAAAAAANIQITADGTVDIDSAGVLTLDSGAAINIEPATGSAILLDGTISVDAGVVTGATSITSTAFVGALTGNVTGNTSGTAATVTTAAQSNITSLGTLTTLAVDDLVLNGATIGHSGDTDLLTLASASLTALGTITVGVDDTGHDVKFFGASAGAYLEWDESVDQLRIMGASADATTSTGKLLLATSLTDINANDILGKIDFQAPHEAGGTDAITIAASIQAMAQGTFSSSVNATDLIFYTGHSEAATEKFRFTSQGELGVGGANYGSDGHVLTSTGAGTAPAWEAIPGASALAADDLTAGDAAVTLSTSSGNIIVDATANNTDIIFKGTDATADITMLTLDGSEAGAATFNDKVIATELDISGNMDIDGTSNLDAVDIDGAVQLDATLTIGANDQGYDVILYGDTASANVTWDTSADDLIFNGAAGLIVPDGQLTLGSTAVSSTAAELNYSDLATLGTSAASKVLSADSNNLSKITGAIYIEEATLSFDATQDWDVRASPVAKVTLTANVTFDAPSNPTTGQFISIVCIQDGTGSRTIAWNAVFEFASDTAPTATTTANLGDMFNFRYNGAKWLEVGRNLALTLS